MKIKNPNTKKKKILKLNSSPIEGINNIELSDVLRIKSDNYKHAYNQRLE